MPAGKITIVNRLGLHARAANKLVSLAKGFESQIRLTREGNSADGKSIMAVLMLAAPKGTELLLEVQGSDEQEAFDAIKALIEDCFGEPE
jgi:phosphocarrier protein